MPGRARILAALAVATTVVAGCGGQRAQITGIGTPQSALGAGGAASPGPSGSVPSRVPALSPYRIPLPVSAHGATTCTVYENNYGTQIVVHSPTLEVRAQCLLWAANHPGVGYVWGYQRDTALPPGLRLCSLTDPRRMLTASVIDGASLVPGSAAERTRGLTLCAGIQASGWSPELVGGVHQGRRSRPISRARPARS